MLIRSRAPKRARVLASVAAVALAAGAFGAGFVGSASAETLREALALAYRTNPTLLAQRAQQRALDETVPQARAGLRPTVSVTASASYSRSEGGGAAGIDLDGDGIIDTPGTSGSSQSDSGNLSIGVSQNIWTAGRVGLGITAAEAAVRAGRENLRAVEQSVLASVIQAYVDVLRDIEILAIRQDNLLVLQRQLEEAGARFEVGEITRTDVAQAEARLAQTESDLATAQAQLSVSRAAYAAVVGQSPGTLEAAPVLAGAPADFDVALDTALLDNPAIRSAELDLISAEARVAQARAEYLPSARLTASYGGSGDLTDLDLADRRAFQAGASISVPLFTGGLNASRVRQATEQANAAQIEVEGQKRAILQQVSSTYAQVLSSRASLQAGEEAVRAASVAAEGVRQEAQVGLRTTLDVLNQELELRSAQVLLASARRNEYVAQAQLLAAMGRLEGEDLTPEEPQYDAEANLDRVRLIGALPWDGVFEAIDRLLAPPVVPAVDLPDAPVDTQLKAQSPATRPAVD